MSARGWSRHVTINGHELNIYRCPTGADHFHAACGADTNGVLVTPKRGRRPGTGKGSNLVKATCGCDTPRIIRIAPATLALAPITCGECGQEFTPPDA